MSDRRGEPATVRGRDLANSCAELLAPRRSTRHLDVAIDGHCVAIGGADGDERTASERDDAGFDGPIVSRTTLRLLVLGMVADR